MGWGDLSLERNIFNEEVNDRKEQVIGGVGLGWGRVGRRSIPRKSLWIRETERRVDVGAQEETTAIVQAKDNIALD